MRPLVALAVKRKPAEDFRVADQATKRGIPGAEYEATGSSAEQKVGLGMERPVLADRRHRIGSPDARADVDAIERSCVRHRIAKHDLAAGASGGEAAPQQLVI